MSTAQDAAAAAYPGGVPPTWRVTVYRTTAQDGRPLLYYVFEPDVDVREVVL